MKTANQLRKVRHLGFLTVLLALCIPARSQNSPKIWASGSAPAAYLGHDIKIKQEPAEKPNAFGEKNRFIISGKRPQAVEDGGASGAQDLKPVQVEVGKKKSGDPVFVELFTAAGKEDEVASQLTDPKRFQELSTQLPNTLNMTDIQIQACNGEEVCAKYGRDEKGQVVCKEYKCQHKNPR